MPHPGDIVLVDFPGVQGTKRRPAIVISTPLYHAARPDVVVGVITSQIAKAVATTDHVLIDWSISGLQKSSAFRSFFATLPRKQVHSTIGRVSAKDWQAIQLCIRKSLDL